jgi:dolichol-phosphate mannosyltransferase
MGLLMSLISLSITFWVTYNFFFLGYLVSAWMAVATAIFLSTGIILTVIGISGIYIGEIFRQVKNRPLYVIDKIL